MINISKNIGKGRVNLLCYQEDKNKLDGNPMKIQEIEITDIGGIPYLKLDNLDPHMNIICGENGVGKTNILNSIAFAFSTHDEHYTKKRAGSEEGYIEFQYSDEGVAKTYKNKVDVFMPEFYAYQGKFGGNNSYRLPASKALYIKTNRVFNYKYTDGIKRDPLHDVYGDNVTLGLDSDDIKSWFITRDLFDGKDYLDEAQRYNINLAKSFLSLLNSSYTFSRIDTDHELMVNTDSGEVYFEYLSSGLKSSFFILLGIIKDIEFKHGKNYTRVDEYEGVILIDEIELHLHPEWQARIIGILKESFPKAQFFITTHSPHVIQSAQHNEIIALEKIESSREGILFEVVERDLPDSLEYGFQGWTIEEILEDVMGMQNTRGRAYEEQMRKFDLALDNSDLDAAKKAYVELKSMIHPRSHMRKMLKIQMAGLR